MESDTMKIFVMFNTLVLVGCAHSIEDPLPKKVEKQPEVDQAEPWSVPRRICVVTSTERIKDCKLLKIVCDDGSEDLALLCPIAQRDLTPEDVPEPF